MAKPKVTKAAALAELTAAGVDANKYAGFSLQALLAFVRIILDLLQQQQGAPKAAAAGCTDVTELCDCNVHCACAALQAALALHECCCPTP